MAKLWQTLLRGARSEARYSFTDWATDKLDHFAFGGMSYPLLGFGTSGSRTEEIDESFSGYVQGAYKANGVVFAAALARSLLFSEARFQYRRITRGRPGDLFGDASLRVLERPWPNGTTGELLTRAEQDTSMGGNFYVARESGRLRRLRPDWVSIVLTVPPDEAVESDVAGYLYRPGGLGSRADARIYLPSEVAHWSPIPDPEAMYRGMSWLTPVVREIQSDRAATSHKLAYFNNAATPNFAVSLKETVTVDQFKLFREQMDGAHQGPANAGKTLYLGGGADVTVLGADLKQMDFKVVQGHGETRVCAAARVPPIIAGMSEGLEAATYSNYGQARRAFADGWARPQWRSICAALESVLPVPAGAELWYDDRDIAFLREDRKDQSEIMFRQAQTIRSLGDAGWTADSIKAAVQADDWSLLVHSGLFSVQLQPPGTTAPTSTGGADDGDAS